MCVFGWVFSMALYTGDEVLSQGSDGEQSDKISLIMNYGVVGFGVTVVSLPVVMTVLTLRYRTMSDFFLTFSGSIVVCSLFGGVLCYTCMDMIWKKRVSFDLLAIMLSGFLVLAVASLLVTLVFLVLPGFPFTSLLLPPLAGITFLALGYLTREISDRTF